MAWFFPHFPNRANRAVWDSLSDMEILCRSWVWPWVADLRTSLLCWPFSSCTRLRVCCLDCFSQKMHQQKRTKPQRFDDLPANETPWKEEVLSKLVEHQALKHFFFPNYHPCARKTKHHAKRNTGGPPGPWTAPGAERKAAKREVLGSANFYWSKFWEWPSCQLLVCFIGGGYFWSL